MSSPTNSNSVDMKNLYVKNIGDMTKEDLVAKFGQFGSISSSIVMRMPDGTSRGFGFVCFEHKRDADNALRALHNSFNGSGKRLHVARAKRKERSPRSLRHDDAGPCELFLRSLDYEIDEAKLMDLFGQYGEVLHTQVYRFPSGESKRSGTVVFRFERDGMKAQREMHGRPVNERPISVEFQQRQVSQMVMGIPGVSQNIFMAPTPFMVAYPPPNFMVPPPATSQAVEVQASQAESSQFQVQAQGQVPATYQSHMYSQQMMYSQGIPPGSGGPVSMTPPASPALNRPMEYAQNVVNPQYRNYQT
ncbi:hypothetical protein L596_022903 [Steinernema carpocapsae]|uniref:RRM domain-containing protein n=1 Tax=Steinernema carpocapsae TaxID=34508 RepID=A0A4U5MBX2_STECR|nr:hypothetical protein L596_022903 [Steinernema carpocapsae]